MASADVDSSQSEFLQHGGGADTQVSDILGLVFSPLFLLPDDCWMMVYESMKFTRFKRFDAWGESRTLPVFPSITATHFYPFKTRP